MNTLPVIIVFGLLMSAIALTGSLTVLLKESTLKKLILPMVAFSSGSLIGGALFHMLPAAIEHMGNTVVLFVWVAFGFLMFMILEHVLHWHHCHRATSEHKKPLGYLILIADGVHNFLGGLAIGALFIVDFKLGLSAWLAAAAHEVPQELGDFGILLHSGWKKSSALIFNLLSGLTFLVGGLVAYFLSFTIEISFLVPFAAGNFLYIGAADLVPEFKAPADRKKSYLYILCWTLGLGLLLAIRLLNGQGHAH